MIDFLICWAFVSGLSAGIYWWRSVKKRWLEAQAEIARIEAAQLRASRTVPGNSVRADTTEEESAPGAQTKQASAPTIQGHSLAPYFADGPRLFAPHKVSE